MDKPMESNNDKMNLLQAIQNMTSMQQMNEGSNNSHQNSLLLQQL